MSGFQLRSGREPDEIDLELLSLDAEAFPEERAALAALPALEPARAELAALERWWRSAPRHLPVPSATHRVNWRIFAAMATACAAAIALWSVQPEPERIHPRGGLPVDVVASRGGAAVAGGLAAGDHLGVALAAGQAGFVSVLTVQDDGAVALLDSAKPVSATERFSLPGVAQLDAHDGREWLIVRLDEAPLTEAELIAQAQATLPDPTRRRSDTVWVMEITRGRSP